jgi:membrane protease YdiL (CAAX protease family)
MKVQMNVFQKSIGWVIIGVMLFSLLHFDKISTAIFFTFISGFFFVFGRMVKRKIGRIMEDNPAEEQVAIED